MSARYRRTPWWAAALCLLILAGAGAILVEQVRSTVAYVSADRQPATITDVHRPLRGVGKNRPKSTVTFATADGTLHADSVRSRFLWRPDEGDAISVYERAPRDWEIVEEFSWVGTVFVFGFCSIPWIIALLWLWEHADRRIRPEKYEPSRSRRRRFRRGGRGTIEDPPHTGHP